VDVFFTECVSELASNLRAISWDEKNRSVVIRGTRTSSRQWSQPSAGNNRDKDNYGDVVMAGRAATLGRAASPVSGSGAQDRPWLFPLSAFLERCTRGGGAGVRRRPSDRERWRRAAAPIRTSCAAAARGAKLGSESGGASRAAGVGSAGSLARAVSGLASCVVRFVDSVSGSRGRGREPWTAARRRSVQQQGDRRGTSFDCCDGRRAFARLGRRRQADRCSCGRCFT